MAAIELPEGVYARDMEHRFIDAGMWQRGPLGGAAVRIDRPGSRYAIALAFPPLESRQKGRLVASRLIQAMRLGLRVPLPLGNFDPGAPGSPVVDGADQAGTSLTVKGFTPHYAIREGQWFTHINGDDAKLYNVAEATVADASGDAVITLSSPLGIEPEDEDVLLFREPVIQGALAGNEARWRLAIERLVSFEIEIEEIA